MVESEKDKIDRLYDLFSRFSNIALFCMAVGAVSLAIWGTIVMGLLGYQVGLTLIIFGYLLNWVLAEWELKNNIKLGKK